MKKVIGLLLLIAAVYLGYMGITKFSDSGKSIDVVGIELSTENNQKKNTSYIYLGFALVSAVGGIALLKNSRS